MIVTDPKLHSLLPSHVESHWKTFLGLPRRALRTLRCGRSILELTPQGFHRSDACNASVPFVPITQICGLREVASLGAHQMERDGISCLPSTLFSLTTTVWTLRCGRSILELIPQGVHSSDTRNASEPFVPITWACVL